MPEPSFAPAHGTDEVLYAVEDGIGCVLLNRPRAINALNLAMVTSLTEQLGDWAVDDSIAAVVLEGAGGRGLSAGADVRAVREQVLSGSGDPMDFFRAEFRLDGFIAAYPKPVEARMGGVVMGGGLGLAAHASRRVVDCTTVAAMPETIIGYVPDAGVLWHLARAGALGVHMALTGNSVDGSGAVAAGLADEGASPLVVPDWMDECYAGDDPVAIAARLAGHPEADARAAAADLALRCPFSVWVTLAALRRAASMSVEQVLEQDVRLVDVMIRRPDFAEGVRAQLVDKDRSPQWQHRSLSEVDPAHVASLFEA